MTVVTRYIDTFFKKYKQEGNYKAIDYIFSLNPLLADRNQLADLKSKLDSTRHLVGNFDNQELITQKSTSNSLVLFSYLVNMKDSQYDLPLYFIRPKMTGNYTNLNLMIN